MIRSLGTYLFVQLYQLSVVYAGLASLGSDVYDNADVSFVFFEIDVVAINVDCRKVVDRSRLLWVGGTLLLRIRCLKQNMLLRDSSFLKKLKNFYKRNLKTAIAK